MKITLVIYAMGLGGAQRVMSILANYWATNGWDVTLITLAGNSRPSFYHLETPVKLIQLGIIGDSPNLPTLLSTGWHRIQVLRKAIIASQPDAIVSFLNTINVITLISTWRLNIPVIVSEHIYPGFTDVNKVWQMLMKLTYRHADLVTLLTQSALPFYPAAKGYRSIVMPNPVVTPDPAVETEPLLARPTLISIGRLQPQKGFDLLIKAFHQVHPKHPDWQLTILGEGPIRVELEALRSRLQLTEFVHLPGQVQNVNAYLRQADIFVLSSRFEGFPMSLCEAMACGLAVIATDCLSGPREIITEGIDGILVAVEDVDSLATGLDTLMSDPAKRYQLALAAPQILDRFGLERVMKMWSDEIEAAILRRSVSGKDFRPQSSKKLTKI
jgi:GalNAc-alpha-(1->4)-GalNAc-alpha-(1->3)-diNAcBac-PP-undecaprenol alpha-1,4-N-acetyl-D-galactosaminyltransferase